jgi:hypothetical protein
MRTSNVTAALGLAVLMGVAAGCETTKEAEAPVVPGQPTAIQNVPTLPCWVTQKGKCLSGEKKVFYGVGNASGLVNKRTLRTMAEGAARGDLAKTFNVYVKALQKQYIAETTAGSEDKHFVEQHVEEAMKQVTAQSLTGSEIVEYWQNPLDTKEAYALARLDIARFVEAMDSFNSANAKFKELDAKMRDYVRKNAEKAFDTLETEVDKAQEQQGK